ncbi:NAD(P)-binding protein, partial [Hesseltinella vesiculosa]
MFFKKNFTFQNIPDLTGKICVITGSNTGIGRVCALEMARKGAHIVMACRSEEKALPVIAEIKKETGNENVEFIALDLLNLQSVKSFVETFKQRHTKLHVLLNNAGVMMCPFGLSDDGIEIQFATNHLAHFYLTTELLPIIENSAPSRIVNVSSMGHIGAFSMNLDTMNDPNQYSRTIQYGRTKAYNIMFTRELTKRLQERGVENVFVNANHPGVVQSDLSRHLFALDGILTRVYNCFNISTEDGSLTQLYLATSPEVEEKKIKGEYYIPYGKKSSATAFATNEDNAKQLWDFSIKLLEEKVPGYTAPSI